MIWIIFLKTLKNTAEIKKCKMLIVFYYMIADLLSNKKLNPVVTELFIKGAKQNVSRFAEPKNIRLNSTHYFIIKTPKQTRTSTNCI